MMLSALLALSATMAMAAAPAAKPAATPQTKEAPKSAPAKPAPAKKDEAVKAEDKAKAAKEKAALDKEIEASLATATKVETLDLLKTPGKHLNQKVTFTGTFNRFADTGLDYKKAFRDSRDYVSFFILRPDVTQHTIPLSELKLFFPRKRSNEVMELETGDKIQMVGTQFSTALDEPWVDVEHIKILQKTDKHERKRDLEF
ncbi:hypothetical protein [Vampirovibrio sp.]|uniref:hypothetical protein n=1 Tax=Vampirovibrio sp. TaxID=2717857 RepID=UPI0035935512